MAIKTCPCRHLKTTVSKKDCDVSDYDFCAFILGVKREKYEKLEQFSKKKKKKDIVSFQQIQFLILQVYLDFLSLSLSLSLSSLALSLHLSPSLSPLSLSPLSLSLSLAFYCPLPFRSINENTFLFEKFHDKKTNNKGK